MYVQIFLFDKSISLSPLTYLLPEIWRGQIQIGSLVEAPLGASLVFGIVGTFLEVFPPECDPSKIRPIHAVLASNPLLSETEIFVVARIARLYFLPLHKALGIWLSAPLMRSLAKSNYLLPEKIHQHSRKRTQKSLLLHHFLARIFSPADMREYLVSGTVIIFPDDIMLSLFSPAISSTSIQIISGDETPANRVKSWKDVTSGKYDIIVGTRRILYYNLSCYRRVVYVEDAFADELYAYPSNIRHLDVLRAFAETGEKEIIIVSSSPTLETLAKFSDGKIITKK